MRLESMTPEPDWDPAPHEAAIDRLTAVGDRLIVRVWCGDWCGDCRRLLPPFAAAVEAMGLSDDAVVIYEVEKRDDGSKVGEAVPAYDIERTPTVLLELDGEEVARFEEGRSSEPIIEALADQLYNGARATG